MFNQIRRLSKALPALRKNPIEKVEEKQVIQELKVPDGSFKGENIRIAGRRLIFLTLKQCLALENDVVCFDISYDHDLLISCTENVLFIWTLSTMEIEQKIEIKLRNKRGEKEHIKITNCAISKDGKYFITIMPSKMIVWNRSTGKVSMMIEIPVETHCIKFSDNGGEYLYASGEDGIIRTWDWKIGKQTSLKLYHPASVRTFDFTHSSPVRFLCGRVDGYCTAWDFERREIIDNIIPEPSWDSKKNEANRGGWIKFEGNHTGSILCLKVAPNKRLLATGSADFTCKLWNIASYGKDTETVKQDRLKENVDLNSLIDITLPYDIDKFGIRIGEIPFTTGFHADIMFTYRHEAPVTILEFNSTSDILYTGSIDSTCRLWSTRKGELIFQINLPAQPQSLIVTPGMSNDMLYLTCQNRLLVFDVKAPVQEKELPVYWRAGQELDSDEYFFVSRHDDEINDINEINDTNDVNDNNIDKKDDDNNNNKNNNTKMYTGEPEKEKIPFEVDEDGNEIDKNDVSNINPHKGKYTFEEVRKLLSHGLIRDSYIETMIDELDIELPKQNLYSNIRKYNISLTQILRSIINDKYKPIDVIRALFTKNNRVMREFANVINKGEALEGVMSILGYKKTPKEELDNAFIFLNNEDIRPITTLELKEMIKNNVFKYAFNKMFNNLSPDYVINDEKMLHDVLHFIPSKQIKLIKDYQNHGLSNKIFMEDLDPKKSLPARYPNFKKSDEKPNTKSIEPNSQNIGRMKRFDEKRVKGRLNKPKEPEPEPLPDEPIDVCINNGYLPLNTKLGTLTKQQKRDLIDLYMDKLFGSDGDKEWKSSGNILHYERYLQAKGLNVNWPFPRYQKKKKFPIKNIHHPMLSHVYVQPILINNSQKNEKEVGLSQLLVGKKLEIQERKPDIDYNKSNKNNLKKDTKTYFSSEFNIPGNTSIKVKSFQKLHKLGDKDNYPTLSTHNLSDQIRTFKADEDKNYQNYQNNISSIFPTTIKRNPENNIENSVINTNIRRLSNLNNTLYKPPEKKNNLENKKLVFHNVMKISSFTDYKDDIEQIEKAIQLSSNMNLNEDNTKNSGTEQKINSKYEPKYKSPLMNDITNTEVNDVPQINENISSEENTEITVHPITQIELNNSDIQVEDISNSPNDLNNTSTFVDKTSVHLEENNQYTNEITENQSNEVNSGNIINENETNSISDVSQDKKNIISSVNNNADNNEKFISNNNNENVIQPSEEKTKQEQRDMLLENELENEKKLDYHLFMGSTQKLGSEQKIDEIVVSEDNNKDHFHEMNLNINDNTSENGEK